MERAAIQTMNIKDNLYFDKNGQPITSEQWIEKSRMINYTIIGKTKVGDKEVSTVWLGLDHSFGLSKKPLIFETLVFPQCDDLTRYSTLEDAVIGHSKKVEELKYK